MDRSQKNHQTPLVFEKSEATAQFIAPSGRIAVKPVEIRINPVTGRSSRISPARSAEREAGTQTLPPPPPDAEDTQSCPFCRPQVLERTPRILPEIAPEGRLVRGASILFPNLFPYGAYSAVSLLSNDHFVEIGTARVSDYAGCLMNSVEYLRRVLAYDPEAKYMAVTQNHLPSAGGSLIHPHFQINADRRPANHHRFLSDRAHRYFRETGRHLFSDYLEHERTDGGRFIGRTGAWEWIAAFAPEGFSEIWGVLRGGASIRRVTESAWGDLAHGIVAAQKFYRSLNRNGYNLGLLTVETGESRLEIRAVMMARSNYAPWVRNDHTGFEVMLGDMTTFSPPEETAALARPFWGPRG